MKTPVKSLVLLLALIIPLPAARAALQQWPIHYGINYIGAHVVSAPHCSAAVLAVSGADITFDPVGWVGVAPVLAAGGEFTVEHPTSGYWDIVLSCAGKTVTLSSNWPYGTAAADKPIIRRVKTLNQLFGSQPKAGTGGTMINSQTAGPPGTADRIWVPDGTGNGYNFYFRNTAGAWRKLGASGIYQGSAPIYFVQGMIYERVAPPSFTLTFSGQPVPSPKQVFLGDASSSRSMLTSLMGIDLVSSLYGLTPPAARTLGTCGLFPIVWPFDDMIVIQETIPSLNLLYCVSDGIDWWDATGFTTTTANNWLLSAGFLRYSLNPFVPTVATLQ